MIKDHMTDSMITLGRKQAHHHNGVLLSATPAMASEIQPGGRLFSTNGSRSNSTGGAWMRISRVPAWTRCERWAGALAADAFDSADPSNGRPSLVSASAIRSLLSAGLRRRATSLRGLFLRLQRDLRCSSSQILRCCWASHTHPAWRDSDYESSPDRSCAAWCSRNRA